MTDAREYDLQCSVMPSVTIYSDGSFKPELGTGGYGSIMTCNGYSQFFYGGFVGTSNNAMELNAVLNPLRYLDRPCRVTIISDSKYVVDGINGWMLKWHSNNWRKSDGGPIKNEALWREMYYFSQHHLLQAVWVKSHTGLNIGNSICDNLAMLGAYSAAGIRIPDRFIDRD